MKRALRTTFVIATLGVFGAIGVGPLASVAGAQELDLCALLGDPYCPPDGTGSGTSDTVVPGGSITVHGEGFLAGETVDITLRSTPIPLGSFTADADGEVTATVTIPADAEPGTHTIVMYGLTSHVSVRIPVEIVGAAGGGGGGGLAATGSDTGPLVGIGIGLLAAGGSAAFTARRRAGSLARVPST